MANDNLYNLSKGEHNIYVYQLDIFVYLHIYVLKVKFYIYLCISVCICVWHLVLILFFKEECMVKSKYSVTSLVVLYQCYFLTGTLCSIFATFL